MDDLEKIATLTGIIVAILTLVFGRNSFFDLYKAWKRKRTKTKESPAPKNPTVEAHILVSHAGAGEIQSSPVTVSFREMMQQGRYHEAVALAPLERERLMADIKSEKPEGELELDDFDVWHARALIYTGETSNGLEKLNRIISKLEREHDDSYRRLRRDLILGRAFNDKGYANWMILGHYQVAIREFKTAIQYFSRQSKGGDQLATACDNLGRVYSQLGHRTKAELLIEHGRNIRANLGENRNNRYALSLLSSGISNMAYGDPYRAIELSTEAINWLSDTNKRARGLGYIIQGQAYRFIGSSWKYKRIEDRRSSREQLDKSLAGLRQAEEIFGKLVTEPIRLLEVYNEIGCTYRELSQLAAANQNMDEATKRAESAYEMLQKSLDIAEKNRYEVAFMDGCEDLARLYKWYAELEAKQSEKWMQEARNKLSKAEELIKSKSPYYKFSKNKSSKPLERDKLVEEYLQQLGKIHILQGHLEFDARNKSRDVPQKRSKKMLMSALENYLLAIEYFGRFLKSADGMVYDKLASNTSLMSHRLFSRELHERLRLLDPATMREVNEEILPKIINEYGLESDWTGWLHKDIIDLTC